MVERDCPNGHRRTGLSQRGEIDLDVLDDLETGKETKITPSKRQECKGSSILSG
jgi:hypothetical protein